MVRCDLLLKQMDNTCPVCSEDLLVGGDPLRMFGAPSEDPVEIGKEVVALECGHRVHRGCLAQWLHAAATPSCPICRSETAWEERGSDSEAIQHRQVSRYVVQGWKALTPSEQKFVKWAWIAAGIVSVTDPVGFLVLSTLLLVITPPLMYGEMSIFLAALRRFIVGRNAKPGVRLTLAIGVAGIITFLAVVNHDAGQLN